MAEITAAAASNHSAVADPVEALDLEHLGYEQELERNIGTYASFAAGFSFVSILTTIFQLFAFGFSFGGPAFFWTWPAVFVGQLFVALMFAELAARWPISGAIYQWATRLGGRLWGWTAGWLMLIGQVVTVAAAAIALQAVLPVLWSGFQFVGDDPSLASRSGSTNAAILGLVLLVACTVINAVGIKVMAIINSTGVTCELVGVVLLVIALFSHAKRGAGVVFDTGGLGGSGYVGALLVSGLMAGYVLVGFDSAGELSEETKDARGTAPRTIIRALTFSGVGGALLLLAALMAAPSSRADSAVSTGGLPYILTSRLGDVLGKIFIADVAVAACVCTLAIQTATTRMVFSMARDRALPFAPQLAKVSPRFHTPILPAVVVGVLAMGVLVVNIFQAALYTALASVCIMLLYIAYLMVTGPMLYRRLHDGFPAAGAPDVLTAKGKPLFTLGRWGLPVNVVAVVWGAAMTVNLAWPRNDVYNFSGPHHWYLQYFAFVALFLALASGALAYWGQKVQNQRTLDELDPDLHITLPGARTASSVDG
jgi:urea carboxylase system permease